MISWRPSAMAVSWLAIALALPGTVRAEARRYAVVVGANIGDAHEARLHFAEADAEKIAQTLRAVGEFPAAQVLQMTGVSAEEVRRALIELNARLRQESSDTVLFVYYSGHADADRLHLGGSYLRVRELRDILAGSSAGSRVLVIDACRSGSMTRVKGGSPTPPFSVHLDEMPPPTGFAILTSSAEGEDSQESDALAGSFFTHYFNSGLIGAADQNHDGQVTLAEAFSFASEQTFRATLATTAGPQHPTFRFELGGRQDLILARPHSPRQGLGIVKFTGAGNYILRRADASGSRPVVAEVASRTGGAEVALPEGRYEITLRNPDHILEGTCEVRDGAVASVSASELRRVDNARLVRKGGEHSSIYSLVLGGGVHSSPYGLGGYGPAAGLALRRDSRRVSLEVRLTWAASTHDNWYRYRIATDQFSATLAALRALDLGPVTLSGGLEAGILVMHQRTSYEPFPPVDVGAATISDPYASQSATLPGQLSGTTTCGPAIAPLLQLDFRLYRKAYARIDAGLPLIWMKVKDSNGETSWQFGRQFRIGAGVGYYF